MMEHEIVVETAATAFQIAELLLTDGHYVVMVSREEQLWIINYEYSDLCNRNDVVFMPREVFEEEYFSRKDFEDDTEEEDGWKQ